MDVTLSMVVRSGSLETKERKMIECRCKMSSIKIEHDNNRVVAGIKGLISAINVSIKNSEVVCIACGAILLKGE